MRVAVSILLLLALTSLAALTFAYWSFGSSIHAELAALESSARTSPDVITEQSLEPLPEPARRYLRHAGVVGTKTPRLVHLTQQGRIRSSAEAQWMTFEAVETYFHQSAGVPVACLLPYPGNAFRAGPRCLS